MSESGAHKYDVVISAEFGDDPQMETARTQTRRLLEQWRGRLVPEDKPDSGVAPRTYPPRWEGDPQVTLHSTSPLHVQADVEEADGMARYIFDGENITAEAFMPDDAPIGPSPDSKLALHASLSRTIFTCDMREGRGDVGQPPVAV